MGAAAVVAASVLAAGGGAPSAAAPHARAASGCGSVRYGRAQTVRITRVTKVRCGVARDVITKVFRDEGSLAVEGTTEEVDAIAIEVGIDRPWSCAVFRDGRTVRGPAVCRRRGGGRIALSRAIPRRLWEDGLEPDPGSGEGDIEP